MNERERMDIVIVGHVDHGKSTVIGRLLADTGTLPEGKLEQVRALCERTDKPFEYAFLLDALKEERAQGITIDTARAFFKSARRDYIIIDAPGHVEFLKNMVTGAARAEAALLIIDAQEGIRENTRRHGYLLSMLSIRQVVVLVNKMDLVGHDLSVFERIRAEYGAFLDRIGVRPRAFIPVSARDGDNLVRRADWYSGPTVLETMDGFVKAGGREHGPLRFPVQDIYKFTGGGDTRRIVAGTVESGAVRTGDEVAFYPSGQRTRVVSIEAFNRPAEDAVGAGRATGFTLADELFIRPGDLMTRASDAPPRVGRRFRAHLFWMGRAPLVMGRRYKLKLGTARVHAFLAKIHGVMDAKDLFKSADRDRVDRHEVADVEIETTRPLAFDTQEEVESTGRFVLVDGYEIAGGGILTAVPAEAPTVLQNHIERREIAWERGAVGAAQRKARFGHDAKLVLFTGDASVRSLARRVESRLFDAGFQSYFLGLRNLEEGLGADLPDDPGRREETVRRLGETARILADAGLIVITILDDADSQDVETLKLLNSPAAILVIRTETGRIPPGQADLSLTPSSDGEQAADQVMALLRRTDVIPEFVI